MIPATIICSPEQSAFQQGTYVQRGWDACLWSHSKYASGKAGKIPQVSFESLYFPKYQYFSIYAIAFSRSLASLRMGMTIFWQKLCPDFGFKTIK